MALAILTTIASAGCDESEDVGSSEGSFAALTDAEPSTEALWAVSIHVFDDSFCSGIVLTEHWLVTAAHCADDAGDAGHVVVHTVNAADPNELEFLYEGEAEFYVHPGHDEWFPRDTDHDIALIRLTDDAGIDLNLVGGGARLWNYRAPQPWRDQDEEMRQFEIIGYGDRDDNQPGECDSEFFGLKELQDGRTIDYSNVYWPFSFYSDWVYLGYDPGGGGSHWRNTCQGDSGGPWMFRDHFGELRAFAITSGVTLGASGVEDVGTGIDANMKWIWETTVDAGLPTSCAAGWEGASCYEHEEPGEWEGPTEIGCPSGEHCCEPGDPGASDCALCMPYQYDCN